MKKNNSIIIFITCSSIEEADKIKDILLQEKKVACVNIIPEVRSFFWWQGKIDTSNEVLLIAKSNLEILSTIVELVKKYHSYDVPEVIALPIINGNREYLEWIDKNVSR